ncbi:MAG: glycosyl hydrolase family 28-related protein [Kiritimatiellae bacterium]|nr:glycosyl hydrolase family 28-related protein [Kiritimatiellia bacterium]MDX9792459.1 glycosyl hydrolase family 28-related protein [Kiritimatiellia bacterium]
MHVSTVLRFCRSERVAVPLMVIATLASILTAPAVEVVATRFPARDVVVAERVLTPETNRDDAKALQAAVDAVAEMGGGTVFLAAGTYTLQTPITVKRGVTLRGDASAVQPAKGTVVAIVCGRGEAEGEAAISLENGSGLEGLVFYYPEQTLANPVPYPWTVRTALHGRAGNNQTVLDCTFVNPWKGLCIGPEVNECHTFRRVRICALETGFLIDMTTDIGRITDVLLAPEVWASSGFAQSPSAEAVRAYLRSHDTVGAEYRRSDWEYIRNLTVRGYRTGVRFSKAKVAANAVIANSEVVDCGIALDLRDLNRVGLACYNTRFAGTQQTVACGADFNSVALFSACTFSGAPVGVNARGTLGFSQCRIDSRIENPAGGRLLRRAEDRLPAASDLVAPTQLAWPRPRGSRVLDAADFGVSRQAADNTEALQAALDAAGRLVEGGTVYVPAGFYACRGTLAVPAGVELRGSSEVPHHTQNAGTVLLVTSGKGDESGTPFLSLAPKSGVRGMGFWYPEQPETEPVPYPWTIRSLGPDCWLTDVNIGNGWQGVDFATNRSDGHRLSYVSGGFFKSGVLVGNCATRGWVEDLQFNPHYVLRRPGGLPFTKGPAQSPVHNEHVLYPFIRETLNGIVFQDCVDEQVTGTFLYAAREGIVFRGTMRAQVLIHGTDTGYRCVSLATEARSRVRMALGQFVPLGAHAEAAVVATAEHAGDAEFHASQMWPRNPVVINRGRGTLTLDLFNSCAGGVVAENGRTVVRLGFFRNKMDVYGRARDGAAVYQDCVAEKGDFKVVVEPDPASPADVR